MSVVDMAVGELDAIEASIAHLYDLVDVVHDMLVFDLDPANLTPAETLVMNKASSLLSIGLDTLQAIQSRAEKGAKALRELEAMCKAAA